MSAAVINAELQVALVCLLAAADEVFAAKTAQAEQVAIAGLALPRQKARTALDDIRRAARMAPVLTAYGPVPEACPSCKGSGEQEHSTGHLGPDDYDVTGPCSTCKGTGEPAPTVRVACITLDGTTLTVPVEQIGDVLHGEDAEHTYTLKLKHMSRTAFEALGEFDGF